MRLVLEKLKIHVNNKIKKNNINVTNIFSALNYIKNNRNERDKRLTRRLITNSLVSHYLRKACFMRQTCVDLKINCKNLYRELARNEILEDPLENDTWAYAGRLPYFIIS